MIAITKTDSRPTLYRLRLNSHGQITLPKALRNALGLVPGQQVEAVQSEGQAIMVTPAKTLQDVADELDDLRRALPEKAKQAIRTNAGKTAAQLRRELDDSSEGQVYYARYQSN